MPISFAPRNTLFYSISIPCTSEKENTHPTHLTLQPIMGIMGIIPTSKKQGPQLGVAPGLSHPGALAPALLLEVLIRPQRQPAEDSHHGASNHATAPLTHELLINLVSVFQPPGGNAGVPVSEGNHFLWATSLGLFIFLPLSFLQVLALLSLCCSP